MSTLSGPRLALFAAAAALLIAALLGRVPIASAVIVSMSDGRSLSGDLTAADEDSITVADDRLPLAQIASVDWGVNADPDTLKEIVVFLNGDRVAGRVDSASTAGKQVEQTTEYGKMTWHAPAVSKVVFDPSPSTQERLDADLPLGAYPIQGEAVPGDRVLVSSSGVRVTSQMFGRKDMERGQVAFAVLSEGRRREFPYRKPYVKVLAQNGDVLSGSIESVTGGKLVLRLPFYTFPTATVELPLGLLARMIVLNGSVVYLSDLEPAAQKNIPYLFSFTAPARSDASFAGTPVSVGGRIFLKGVCTRARTELTYALDRKYETFDATIGVDDSVLSAGGSVRFLVYGEDLSGKPLYESELLPGPAAQTAAVHLRVAGVTRLILVTDWGPRGDIGAHGCWAGARLVRK